MSPGEQYTLAIDTSATASAALVQENRVLAERSADARGGAEALVQLAQTVFSEIGIGFSEVSKIVVCVGPGSFTGIRTGIAFAEGLRFRLNVPVVGVSALLARAFAFASAETNFASTLRANQNESFLSEFRLVNENGQYRYSERGPVRVVETEKLDQETVEWGGFRVDESNVAGARLAGLSGLIANQIVRDSASKEALQISLPGVSLAPLYIKGVNAKTILERQAGAVSR